MDEARLRRGVAELERLGFAVRVADGVLERRGFTAGSVETALAAAARPLRRPGGGGRSSCARGGAGTIQLLPGLDRDLIAANPKPLLGYSDVTLLHLELERLGLVSLHGPMVARELAEGDTAYDRGQPVARPHGRGPALRERARRPRCPAPRAAARASCAGAASRCWPRPRARPGRCGRVHEPTILFVEDVDEKPYRVDRMLRQLRASGALRGRARGRLRRHEGLRPGLRRRTTGWRTILLEALEGFDVPVALGLSSGHTAHPNVTLPFGVRARLECPGEEAQLRACSRRPSREGPPLGDLRHGHGVARRPPARARPRGDAAPTRTSTRRCRRSSRRSASPSARPTPRRTCPADADLVVIGNALSRGNPEVEAVLDRQAALHEPARAPGRGVPPRPRTSLVVAGTHGKTTTTSLLAFLLHRGRAATRRS